MIRKGDTSSLTPKWPTYFGRTHPRRYTGLDIIEDVIPLHDVALSLRIDGGLGSEPRTVYLAPDRQEIPFEAAEGYVRVTVPRVEGHAMVVYEL